MPGIRRTNANQAQTRDPFEALMKVDANRVNRSFRSEQDLLAREAKRGMFDEEIAMKGSQFDRTLAERQAQNAISNANAAARLGLSREGLALRRKALNAETAAKMSWAEKERFKEKMYKRGQGTRYKDYSKDTTSNGSSGSGKSAITPYQRETLHSDDIRILEERDANMRADNLSYNDRAAAISSDVEDTAFVNPFNWNKNALRSQTF